MDHSTSCQSNENILRALQANEFLYHFIVQSNIHENQVILVHHQFQSVDLCFQRHNNVSAAFFSIAFCEIDHEVGLAFRRKDWRS